MNNFTKAFLPQKAQSIKWVFAVLALFFLNSQDMSGQTLYDSFTDGNFTASPVWGGSTSSWGIQANSDAAAGATGSNTVRLASTAVAATDYLSSQIASWSTAQEWGFWVGRRSQAYTAANQMYIWLYANESNLTSATVDGYRLAIGDDSGVDNIRLEYIVNGAVSSTVITSSGGTTNGITDIGFLVRVTRSASGAWEIFTSTLPTANGSGAIATDIPNSTNASVSQGSATNNTLVPAANGYIGFAALHSSGANAIVANEIDQIYFTPASSNYTMAYDGNSQTSGTAPTDSSSPYSSGATVSTLANSGGLTRTNYDFSGWNTQADGLGTDYAAPQASAFNITANTTLYAKWTGTVTYNGNGNTGGSVPSAGTGVIAGDTYTVAANPNGLSKTGFTFGGWNTQADGLGTNYASGTGFFAFAGDVTLYAKWDAVVNYTLTYNGNGNTGGSAPVDGSSPYVSGTSVNTLGNTGALTRTGYTFSGWNTLATGLGTTYTAPQTGAFNISANTTLYAKWTGTVTYNGNGNTGGSVPSAATGIVAGDTYTVANNTGSLVQTGFVFGGWNTQADGLGTNYTAGSGFFTFGGNITLYAKWNSGPCLTEDFAGGSRPSGWVDSGTGITYGSNYADMSVNTGTITMIAVANPGTLTFDLARTSNSTAKNLNIEVSTTSQSSGFSVVTNYDHSNTVSNGTTACTVDLSAYNGAGTVYIRFNKTSGSTSPWRIDNVNVYCVNPATISTLAAYGTQPSGNIGSGTNDAVLAGFSVTPTPSADFTSVTVTGVSSSPSDITNVRIFRDNNGNGLIDGADASVSGAGIAFANGNLSAMTISGETGFSGARNYLIVADISASPSSTSVGVSIGSGNFVTSLASNTGSMAVNTRTLIVPTSTLAAYGTFTGNITKGTTDALLAGFSVTPSESANFTSVTLTGVSTAPGDITSVRIFRDNNGNGAY
jgi:uncharacterized repeat protein (TIGR02543 family)